MRIYVDTNVYLDYLLERKSKRGKDLGGVAAELFARAVSCEFEVVLSDLVMDEVRKYVSMEQARMLLVFMQPKALLVHTLDEDRRVARTLSTHFADALHAALARRTECELIVTRNKADFREIIEAKRPEEI